MQEIIEGYGIDIESYQWHSKALSASITYDPPMTAMEHYV